MVRILFHPPVPIELTHIFGVVARTLKQAAAGHPDLVLMDIRLAGCSDGIETARKMQAERPANVVFVTARVSGS